MAARAKRTSNQGTLTALKRSERQFRLLADHAPVLIWRADRDKKCDFFNKPWLDFRGRSLEQELGFGWAEGIHPDDYERCLAIYITAFDARQPFSMDYRLRRHDGVYRWVLDNGRPYFDEDGTFCGYFGSCIDITDRKDAEEQLRLALHEKEALLAELHHRVKNNMQLVVGLIGLQGARETDPAVRRTFEAMAARVRSLTFVQDQFYHSESLARINIGRYIRSLCQALMDVQGVGNVRLTVDVADIEVSLQRATPIGLIVNELVSNALRHAFPDGRGGQVQISATEDGVVRLVIADDGVGLPDGVYPQAASLGLQLVRNLARQAEATIAVDRGPGTRFVITFPP